MCIRDRVVGAAGLGADAAHPGTTERLAAYQGPGYPPVHVEIAYAEVAVGAPDVPRTSRVYASGERVVAVQRHLDSLVEAGSAHDRKYRSEDLLLGDDRARWDIHEYVRCHEVAVPRRGFRAPRQLRF